MFKLFLERKPWKRSCCNIRAQGLPITTVVLITIAIIGLAVILIFFFMSQSSSGQSTGTYLNLSVKQSFDACMSTLAFGGCPADEQCCSNSTGKCHKCDSSCSDCSNSSGPCDSCIIDASCIHGRCL